MKLLHIADLHLGKSVCGFSLLEDQRHALGEVVRMAVDQEADALLIAGDVYDKSSPSAAAVSLLDWFFCQLIENGIPCYVVPGNHDSAERLAYAAGPLARQGIHVAPPFDGALGRCVLEDRHGEVNLWLLPFVRPADVRAHFPDDDIGSDYTAACNAALRAAAIDPAERNVLVAHQFVTSGGDEPERSDSELSVGGLDNVDASAFEAFDYVALGHIHRPQRIGRDQTRYAGSLLKYSASETGHVKSATLVTLGAKEPGAACAVGIEQIPIVPLRDMRRIKGPLAELLKPEVAAAQNAEDYLHVTLTDPVPALDALARLRATYPNVMSLEYDAAPAKAMHAGTLPPSNGAAVQTDLAQLFERFFAKQTGDELTEAQRRIVSEAFEGKERQ